jgi:hypothetical protein
MDLPYYYLPTRTRQAMNEDNNQSSNKDRPRGILSEADREFLQGKKDLSKSAERNARQRIRQRVKAGLADFELLWMCLSDRDLELIFHPEENDERHGIRSWSQHAIAFIRLGLWTNRDPHAERIADAIEQAAFAAGWATDAELELTKERLPEGDLLLAKIQHKNGKINELRKRVSEGDFGEATREDLQEELNREASMQYYLYEQAMQDPAVDAEELASVEILGLKDDLTGEDIVKEREGWDETPVVRQPMPVIVNVSPATLEEDEKQQPEGDT